MLAQLIFGYWQGFFILFQYPIYAWWLSVAAIPLNVSWWLHNVIAWLKLKPFLSKTASRIFIGTVILVIPYWITEIYANFAFFHNVNEVFLKTRPWEALCRDPWWIFAAGYLFYSIKTKYDLTIVQIVRISPRFAVMLAAMILSIIFIILDVLSVTDAFKQILPVGINPFWKLSFVFKCLTDSVILDDFKTALDRLRAFKISRLGSFAIDASDQRSRDHMDAIHNANSWSDPATHGVASVPNMTDSVPAPAYEWRTNEASVSHVERRQPDILRIASRDRDLEEAGVKVLDHAGSSTQSSDPDRPRAPSWQERAAEPDCHPDLQYAMAMREVASNGKKHSTSSAGTR